MVDECDSCFIVSAILAEWNSPGEGSGRSMWNLEYWPYDG